MEYSDSLLAAIRSEHHILLIGNKNPRNRGKVRNRTQVLVSTGIDHVDRIVRRVGDIEYSGLVVYGGVVEAALLPMCGQFYVAEMFEKIRDLPCRLRDIVL